MSPTDTTQLHIDVAELKVKTRQHGTALRDLGEKVEAGNSTLTELLTEARATKKAIRGLAWVLGVAVTAVGLYQMVMR